MAAIQAENDAGSIFPHIAKLWRRHGKSSIQKQGFVFIGDIMTVVCGFICDCHHACLCLYQAVVGAGPICFHPGPTSGTSAACSLCCFGG